MERRLAAILAADVVGYGRLMGDDEEETVQRLSGYREVIDGRIDTHGGRVFGSAGDSVIAEFASPVEAVRCAVEIQQSLEARNADLSEDRRMRFRIGVNLGDVIVEGDNLLGDGVNVAARLEALAEPGGICLSRAARDQVQDKLDIGLDDLGEIEVKNIARPVQVYRVVLDGGAVASVSKRKTRAPRNTIAAAALVAFVVASMAVWLQYGAPDVDPAAIERMAHALPEKPSVAVLPFDNMSGDKEQDYFADGMVDDLITDLSKIPGLFVISRNSTFTYKGEAVRVQQVAEDLGVQYVVEGSVRRAGDKLRINVQVIDALSGGHVWAERYDGAMADIFDLQDNVTAKIVTALAVKLVPREAKAAHGTDNPAAYDAVLRGWNYLQLSWNDPDNYVLAREQFEKALRLDPNYSRAHLSMAAVWWWSTWAGEYFRMGATSYPEGLDLAKSYLKTAMQTPTALGHRIQAEMYGEVGQLDQAVAEAERAVALDPNNPEGYGTLAEAQTDVGQLDLALKNLEVADRLNPKNLSLNWITHGKANLLFGNYAEAARYLELSVAAAPAFIWTYRYLIAAYGHLGKKAEAKAAIEKLNQLRTASGYGVFTLAEAVGETKLKRDKDRQTYLQGLEKAGLKPGGDVKATQQALDRIVSQTEQGYYRVQGATIVTAKEVKALLEQGVAVFEMRHDRHWKAGHPPGALYARKVIGEFNAANLGKTVKKDEAVVFYCGGFT